MSTTCQYVGLDVSLKETSICVINDDDKMVWRGRSCSTPQAIAAAVKQRAPHAVRVGLESGQLSSWLFHELKACGLPVICVDARHARAALSLKVNKTDANDAQGLAQIMRVNVVSAFGTWRRRNPEAMVRPETLDREENDGSGSDIDLPERTKRADSTIEHSSGP